VVGCRGAAAFVSSRWLHDAQYQVPHDGASSRHEVRAVICFLLFIELDIVSLWMSGKQLISARFHLS
jgi:hypothetical protein